MLAEQKQILFLCFLLLNRLCLQYAEDQHSLDSSNRYNGMLDALRKIYKTEGFRGLYRVSIQGFYVVFFSSLSFLFLLLEEEKEERVNGFFCLLLYFHFFCCRDLYPDC